MQGSSHPSSRSIQHEIARRDLGDLLQPDRLSWTGPVLERPPAENLNTANPDALSESIVGDVVCGHPGLKQSHSCNVRLSYVSGQDLRTISAVAIVMGRYDNRGMAKRDQLPRYLKEWREARGLSQDEAAFAAEQIATEWGLDVASRKIPTSRASISRIETGDVDYTPVALELLGAVYGCHPLALISRRPEEQSSLWEVYSQLDHVGRERLESYAEGVLAKSTAA